MADLIAYVLERPGLLPARGVATAGAALWVGARVWERGE